MVTEKDSCECTDSMADFMLMLFNLIMLHQSASLPQWVYRVNSCPDSKNISQWIEASKRLNCFHNLTSSNPTEQERIYHCLPSSFLNETVEFCSRSVPIQPGNCPVYSYEFGTSTTPISYNCTRFTSGCPTTMFKSKEVYKFPNCLKLHRKLPCFEVERNCTSASVIGVTNRDTNAEKLVTLFLCCFSVLTMALAVVGILHAYTRYNLQCQKCKTCCELTFCQTICYSTETEFEKDPLLSSKELKSEEKLNTSVLPRNLSPKHDILTNTSCKGNPIEDLTSLKILKSSSVQSDMKKDDRCESRSTQSSMHLTQHSKIRKLDTIFIDRHIVLTSKNIIVKLIEVIENTDYRRGKPQTFFKNYYKLPEKKKIKLRTKIKKDNLRRKEWIAIRNFFYNYFTNFPDAFANKKNGYLRSVCIMDLTE